MNILPCTGMHEVKEQTTREILEASNRKIDGEVEREREREKVRAETGKGKRGNRKRIESEKKGGEMK